MVAGGTGGMVPSGGEMFAMCARWAAVGGPFGAPPGRRRGVERRWRPSTRATPFAVVVARALMQKVFIGSQVAGSVEPARTIASTSASASVPTRPPSSTAKGMKRLSGLAASTRSRCLSIFLAPAAAAAAPSTTAASPLMAADFAGDRCRDHVDEEDSAVGEKAANGEVGFEARERVRRGGMNAVADGKTVKAS